MPIRSQRVQFEGAFGAILAARLELPAGPPVACALFAHCFTCSKDFKAVVHISRFLAESGIAVCRFDFTGLGESQGEFVETNFSSNLQDLLAASNFLRSEHEGPQILIGHSLGGAAMIAAATQIPEARAVITIGAPSDTGHLGGKLLDLAPGLATDDEAMVSIARREFRVRRQLLDDLAGHRMESYLAALDRPLLVMHSPEDEVVGIDNAEEIFRTASYPKAFVSLDGADHLLMTRDADWRFVASTVANWAARYLDLSRAPESDQIVGGADSAPSGDR